MGKKKYLVVLGSVYSEADVCVAYLEERGLNVQWYTFLNEVHEVFNKPVDGICGVVFFPVFAVKDEHFMTIRGPIPDTFKKKIRLACRKQGIPVIQIDSFDGSDAVKKKIKTWLRSKVFKG